MGDRSGGELSEEEMLLELQKGLRAEMRLHVRQGSRQVLSGITVIGAIIGYSLYAETLIPIASVPFVLGLVFIEAVDNANGVMRKARHMIDIEIRLTPPGSPFQYEIQRGVLLGSERPGAVSQSRPWLYLNLYGVPEYVRLGVLLITYVASIAAAVWVFWPPEPIAALMVSVSRGTLLAGYVVYSLLLVVVGISHMELRRRHVADIERALGDSEVNDGETNSAAESMDETGD
jgi:hypothetical protein